MFVDPLSLSLWIAALSSRGAPFTFDRELADLTERCVERWPPVGKA